MTITACCWACAHVFEFTPAGTPTQWLEGNRAGRAVAYYPCCPRCGEMVEVSNPAGEGSLPVAPAQPARES